VPGPAGSVTGKTRMWPRPTSGPPFHDVPGPGRDARQAGAAEAAAIRARRIIPLPPAQPVPDMLYIEVEGTGVPVRASETEGRQGKAADGRARTREIKLARLFTQSGHRAGGKPVMDPTGAVASAARQDTARQDTARKRCRAGKGAGAACSESRGALTSASHR
jgi:hypothetical protein